MLLIGNPPFGRSSKLAREVWDHYADYVGYTAFLVPRSMAIPKFYSSSKTVPLNHDVLFTLSLPTTNFILPSGKTHAVKGVALIVSRNKKLRFE